jgi:hypothetical protein
MLPSAPVSEALERRKSFHIQNLDADLSEPEFHISLWHAPEELKCDVKAGLRIGVEHA